MYMPEETSPEQETLKEIINDILEKKEGASTVENLSEDTSLTADLGFDSLDLAEMTVQLEDEYGVDVFEDDIVDQVSEVLEKLNK